MVPDLEKGPVTTTATMAIKIPGPSVAEVVALRDGVWETLQIDLLSDVVLPKTCFVFLHSGKPGKWYKDLCSDEERKTILAPFMAPDVLRSQMCTLLNGYFGSKTSMTPKSPLGGADGRKKSRIKSATTWFRILTKRILRDELMDDGKDYMWYEMGFFTHYDSTAGTCRMLCIDTPSHMGKNLVAALKERELELRNPLSLVLPVMDLVVNLCDGNTWGITKVVRAVEKKRDERPDFRHLRDLARHTGHLVEVKQVAIETLERLAERQARVLELLADELDESYREHEAEYLAFQLQMVRSLRCRAQSTHERLAEEINLAYNMLASSDNTIMKSITLLTMIFFPATFVATLFSTSFFTLEDGEWQMAPKFWIFWAISVPFTGIMVFVWRSWLGGSDKNIRSRWLHGHGDSGASDEGLIKGLGLKKLTL